MVLSKIDIGTYFDKTFKYSKTITYEKPLNFSFDDCHISIYDDRKVNISINEIAIFQYDIRKVTLPRIMLRVGPAFTQRNVARFSRKAEKISLNIKNSAKKLKRASFITTITSS